MQIKRKSVLSLKRRRGLKFRALRKGDELYKSSYDSSRYLAVVDLDDRVVSYVCLDGLFDDRGNYYEEC